MAGLNIDRSGLTFAKKNKVIMILKIFEDISNEDNIMMFFMGGEQKNVSADSVSNFVNGIAPDDNEIDCRIHCRGGSVVEGYAIHDIIQNSGKVIKMTVEGQCASIATVVLLSAKPENRSMYQNATLFIHNPFIPYLDESLTSDKLLEYSNDLKKEEDRLLDFYVANTTANREELKAMMDAETSLNADEAIKLGFISKKIIPILNKKSLINNFKMDETKFLELQNSLKDKDTLINKILKKMNWKATKDVLAMEINTSEGTLTVECEGTSIAVGDKASPDGTFTKDSGDVITVSGGKITSIDEPAEETMDAVKKKCASLETELAELKALKVTETEDLIAKNLVTETENADLKAKQVVYEAEIVAVQELHTELKALKSTYVPAKRNPNLEIEGNLSAIQQKVLAAQEKRKSRNK